jgi:hypothetical protein
MLYYSKDHSSVRPLSELLDSVETFLEITLGESRFPVHAAIYKWDLVPPGNRQIKIWADSMWLNSGFGTQDRVDAVVTRVRRHSDESNCAMSVRWIPNFVGPSATSFDIIGINPQMRTEGGTYAHYIAVGGSSDESKGAVRTVAMCLVLPFDSGSPELKNFMEAARVADLALSPVALRRLERTKSGGFKTRRIRP